MTQPPNKAIQTDGLRPPLIAEALDAPRASRMFGRKKHQNELDAPPIAGANPEAVELLRVWAAPGAPQQLALRMVWSDPGAWGLLLADIARHAAQAYERQGQNQSETLGRIRDMFEAEWRSPTDDPENLTDGS